MQGWRSGDCPRFPPKWPGFGPRVGQAPWIDKDVRHLIHKKYTILKKYRQNKSEERKRKLRVISQNIKTLMKNKHREYLDKIESSFKSN